MSQPTSSITMICLKKQKNKKNCKFHLNYKTLNLSTKFLHDVNINYSSKFHFIKKMKHNNYTYKNKT